MYCEPGPNPSTEGFFLRGVQSLTKGDKHQNQQLQLSEVSEQWIFIRKLDSAQRPSGLASLLVKGYRLSYVSTFSNKTENGPNPFTPKCDIHSVNVY